MADDTARLSELVAQVAAAYFANSHVAVADIPMVMRSIAVGLAVDARRRPAGAAPQAVEAASPAAGDAAEAPPAAAAAGGAAELPDAVQIRNSVRKDSLISFEDGRPYKMLRLHLKRRGLTPTQYREKWGLPETYPMTAPNHSAARAAIAKRIGFGGRKPREGRKA